MTTLYDDPFLSLPSEGSILEKPSSGIGMAPKPSMNDSLRDEYSKMSRGQEIFARIGEFGAGVTGASSPMQARLKAKREDKLLQMEELKGSWEALEHGTKLLEGLQGEERTKFAESYGARLEGVQAGLGATFKALSAKPDLAKQLSVFGDKSPTIKRALQADPTGKTAFKLLSSIDAQKTIQSEMDAGQMPVLLRKGQTFLMGWQQLVPPEMAEGITKDGRVTASELIRANEWIKANKPDVAKSLAITDDELEIVNRNSEAFYGSLGILSPKDEGEVTKDKAKKEGAAPPQRTIKRGAEDVNQEWKDGKWADAGKGPRFKPEDNKLTDEVKSKVAAILLKVLGGEQPTTDERSFLDEVARTKPLDAVIRDALGRATPQPSPSPQSDQDVEKRFKADPEMKGRSLGAKTAKGYEVKDGAGKLVGYYK